MIHTYSEAEYFATLNVLIGGATILGTRLRTRQVYFVRCLRAESDCVSEVRGHFEFDDRCLFGSRRSKLPSAAAVWVSILGTPKRECPYLRRVNLRAPARTTADMQRSRASEPEGVGVVRDAGAMRGERLARVEAEIGGSGFVFSCVEFGV